MRSPYLKINIRTFLLFGFLILTWIAYADGVIHNGTTMKVHSGTFFIESGNRTVQNNALFDIWGCSTINGILVNSGDYQSIIIESDVNGTGSLIYNSGNPDLTVERYLNDAKWHMISPSTNNVLTGQYFFNNSPTVWLKDYNEADDTYNYITSLTLGMPRGKGYAFWVGESKTNVVIEIHGQASPTEFTLNSSSSPALEFTNSSHGYNLIGNPFTSAIDWDNPNWTMSNMEESIWVWDPSTGNFKTRNSSQIGDMPNGIIPSSQGFFIRATSSTASITVPTEAKLHNSQALYKTQSSTLNDLSYIVIQVYEVGLDSVTDQVWVGFHENASNDFDNGLDISKLMGDATSPQLYLQEDRHLYTADLLPELHGEAKTVALKFRAPHTNNYILDVKKIENLDGVQIFIEDLIEDTYTNIKEQNKIKFSADKQDSDNRFVIHFNPALTLNNNINIQDPLIYSNKKSIYLSLNKPWSNKNKTVSIYDVTGRLLLIKNLTASSFYKIPTSIQPQTVIIKLQFEDRSFTKKLMLR